MACSDIVVVTVNVEDNSTTKESDNQAAIGDPKPGSRHGNHQKTGTLGCILRLKHRISHHFIRMYFWVYWFMWLLQPHKWQDYVDVSREEETIPDTDTDRQSKTVSTSITTTMAIQNGFTEKNFLQIVDEEPNGNVTLRSELIMKSDSAHPADVDNLTPNMSATKLNRTRPTLIRRQWSALDGPAHSRVISGQSGQLDVELRQRKPPRPKSECILVNGSTPKLHRFSAFRGDSPFGKPDTYLKLDQLGEGSYATVYKGISNLNNKIVALKEIRLLEEEGTPFTAIREASLLKDLRHANIVTLHDIIHTKETLTFVFEFVNTDLSQYMESHGGGLHPHNVKLFLFQLLRGLSYIHGKRVLHRDLKPQNLLISEIGELKLADFGLARAKSVPSRTFSHEVVTLWYRPPDVLLGSTDYSTSLDMWGVGCIFVEMIIGVATFPGIKDASDQLDKIWKVFGTPTEETWKGVSRYPNYKAGKFSRYKGEGLVSAFPKLNDIQLSESLASQLLQVQPQLRLSSMSAIRHQYFAELPSKIYDLPDQVSVYNVPGCRFMAELHNKPTSVIRAVTKLRDKM